MQVRYRLGGRRLIGFGLMSTCRSQVALPLEAVLSRGAAFEVPGSGVDDF